MTVAHQSILYDVNDLHIWPMLTDTAGASPTYGAAIDVPGVSQVSIDPTITANSLKGDGRTMASRARLDDFAFKATYGEGALAVLDAVLNGDGVVDATHVARSSLVLPRSTGKFAVRFVITDVDLGLAGLVVTAFSAQLSGGTLIAAASDAYAQPTLEATCIQPQHNTNEHGAIFVDFTPCVDFALWDVLPSDIYTVLPH